MCKQLIAMYILTAYVVIVFVMALVSICAPMFSASLIFCLALLLSSFLMSVCLSVSVYLCLYKSVDKAFVQVRWHPHLIIFSPASLTGTNTCLTLILNDNLIMSLHTLHITKKNLGRM